MLILISAVSRNFCLKFVYSEGVCLQETRVKWLCFSLSVFYNFETKDQYRVIELTFRIHTYRTNKGKFLNGLYFIPMILRMSSNAEREHWNVYIHNVLVLHTENSIKSSKISKYLTFRISWQLLHLFVGKKILFFLNNKTKSLKSQVC